MTISADEVLWPSERVGTSRKLRSGRRSGPVEKYAQVEKTLLKVIDGARRRRARSSSTGILGELTLWTEAFAGSGVNAVRRVRARGSEERRVDRPRAVQRRGASYIVLDILMWAAAVLGALTIAITVVGTSLGYRPVIIKTGSMAPTIQAGSVLLARQVPPSELRIGDIATVDRPDGIRVTHRIVKVDDHGASATLVLKGDANRFPDVDPVTVRKAYKLVWSVPKAGWISHAATPMGGFILGGLVAATLLVPVRARSPEPA